MRQGQLGGTGNSLGSGSVKRLFHYFKDILKFYEVGTPRFVQLVFVIMLAILFGSILLINPHVQEVERITQIVMSGLAEANDNTAALRNVQELLTPERQSAFINNILIILGVMTLARIIAQVIAIFYGYVWHLNNLTPDLPLGFALKGFLFAAPRLLLVNTVFFLALIIVTLFISVVFAGLSFIVPGIVVMLSFIIPLVYLVAVALFAFRDMSVLSAGTGLIKTFIASWKLTEGSRKTVVSNLVTLQVLGFLISSLAGGNSTASPVAAFAVSFVEVIMILVTQRLVVRMYEDARGMVIKAEKTE